MSKFLVLLANGNETIEIFTVVDYLRRVDITVDMVSTEDSLDLITSQNIKYQADKLFSDINPDDYDGLYIPGGTEGAKRLRENDKVLEVVKKFNDEEKIVAAICAGPTVLNKAGILNEKRATSFPTLKNDMDNVLEYVDDEIVVTDGNITTGRGAAVTNYLALRLVEILKGKDAVEELKKGIQQDNVEKYYNIDYKYIIN